MLLLNELRALIPSLRPLNDPSIEKKLGKEKVAEACDFVEDYIGIGAPNIKSVNERGAMINSLLRLLMDWMAEQKIPVTGRTILDSIYVIPHAVEESYPTYYRAGMLRAIIAPTKLSA